jgi:hypothetical protein
MSVVETIRGLRKMSVADGEDGAAATPPPSPRNAHWSHGVTVATVVAGLGGLDGLRGILMQYWRSDKGYILDGFLERRFVPKDLVELLTKGIEEAFCRGFLDDRRAVDMAVRRVQVLIEENITLPLTPVDETRVFQLIRENEKHDWKLVIETMTQKSRPAT